MDYQPNIHQRVNVVSSAEGQEAAKTFHRMLARWYRALRSSAQENEEVILEYHTPAGERIEVNQAGHPPDSDMLIIQGVDADGRLCQALARASVLQVMYRIVPRQAGAERRPIGFEYRTPE